MTESKVRKDAVSQMDGRSASRLGVLYLVAGLTGLTAAVILQLEKIELIKNPDYVPTCSINPVLSCGSIMSTPQAEAFGIPNPLIGIAGFAVVATIGASILAGARFRGWFWLATQAGVTFAGAFVLWLISQSLFVLGAICLYCVVVWAVVFPLFWYTTGRVLQPLLSTGPSWTRTAARVVVEYLGTLLTATYLAVLVLVAVRFWDYWTTLV